jgi:hypothetical protein
VYRVEDFPDVDDSPAPRFDLLDLDAYASMAVQHPRGCPFSCEFCDIWKLYGRRHRVKSPDRMTAELDALLGANKPVNVKLDLMESVRRIQARDIEVSGAFIVAFDEDAKATSASCARCMIRPCGASSVVADVCSASGICASS